MAYVPNDADARLRVEFYDKEITRGPNPRSETWIKIFNPGDNRTEHHAPAHSVWAPVDGEDVTYAMRFAAQYKAFKDGDSTRKLDRLEELRKQLAIAEAEAGVTKPLDAKGLADAVKQATAERDAEQRKNAAANGEGDLSDLSDDDLRAAIEAKTGEKVPGTVTKRATLERMYREA